MLSHVVFHPPIPATMSTTMVSNAPPIKPSTVFPGEIHERKGVRPAAAPTNSAPTSFATTARASIKRVSVPLSARSTSPVVEKRRINPAYAPASPTHTIGKVVIDTFGSGPMSTDRAPIYVPAVAMNAKTMTSGSAPSPCQYAAIGAITQATIPGTTAGR